VSGRRGSGSRYPRKSIPRESIPPEIPLKREFRGRPHRWVFTGYAIGEERRKNGHHPGWKPLIAGIRSDRIPGWAPSPCRLPGPVTRYGAVVTATQAPAFRAPVSVCGAGCAGRSRGGVRAGQSESGRLGVARRCHVRCRLTESQSASCTADAPRRAPRRRVRKQTLWSQSPPTRSALVTRRWQTDEQAPRRA
jgi:hypothetical protein